MTMHMKIHYDAKDPRAARPQGMPSTLSTQLKTYAVEELQRCHELIQKYYENHTSETTQTAGANMKWLNYKKLSIAYGATDKTGGVILTGWTQATDHRGKSTCSYDKPTRQSQLENLLTQYNHWRSGRVWAEQDTQKKQNDQVQAAAVAKQDDRISSADPSLDFW